MSHRFDMEDYARWSEMAEEAFEDEERVKKVEEVVRAFGESDHWNFRYESDNTTEFGGSGDTYYDVRLVTEFESTRNKNTVLSLYSSADRLRDLETSSIEGAVRTYDSDIRGAIVNNLELYREVIEELTAPYIEPLQDGEDRTDVSEVVIPFEEEEIRGKIANINIPNLPRGYEKEDLEEAVEVSAYLPSRICADMEFKVHHRIIRHVVQSEELEDMRKEFIEGEADENLRRELREKLIDIKGVKSRFAVPWSSKEQNSNL